MIDFYSNYLDQMILKKTRETFFSKAKEVELLKSPHEGDEEQKRLEFFVGGNRVLQERGSSHLLTKGSVMCITRGRLIIPATIYKVLNINNSYDVSRH